MIDFYTWAAPNGRRVAIMLEECGLPHRTHPIDLTAGEHDTPVFRAINPAGAIPVIVDHEAQDGALTLSQSAAILLYLADKTGRFLPAAGAERARVVEALMLVMTDVAAAAVAGFLLTRLNAPAPDAATLYRQRLRIFLHAVDERLAQTGYLAGDYSIADMALYPISRLPIVEAALDGQDGFSRLLAWRDRLALRPAVVAGMTPPNLSFARP